MKVCLVIIYNHNYEKNIDALDRIYSGRFSYVWHVMPFYRGDRKNVIGVYECSYQFNGYICQAAKVFYQSDYTHYVFVADDMVLNPKLTEKNITGVLKLAEGEGFISYQYLLTNKAFLDWCGWALPGVLNMLSTGNATEWRGFMPSVADAREKFNRLGLDWRNCASRRFVNFASIGLNANKTSPYIMKMNSLIRRLAKMFSQFQMGRKQLNIETDKLLYPLIRGYSDFFVVPQIAAKEFFRECGVFAAMRQFVEIAIPTALSLTCRHVKTLKDSGLKADPPGEYGVRLSACVEKRYDCSYKRFMEEFPEEYIYIHPVKLSRWGDLP